MKKAVLICICLLVFFLSACSNNNSHEAEDANDGTNVKLIDSHFEEFAYRSDPVEFSSSGEFIQAAIAHDNRIYYVHFEYGSQDISTLIVTGFNADGSDIKRIEMQSPGNEVASFNVTDDGNFAFFILNRTLSQQNFNVTAYYVEYDSDGNEITRKEFGDFTLIENPQPNTFAVLSDGRVIAIEQSENELCELDFNTRDLGDSFTLAESTGRVHNIFSAQPGSPYDFLVSDDSYLYGYNINNNEQTIILSWSQLGFAELFPAGVGIFNNGSIFLLTTNRNTNSGIEYELYILTPGNKNEMPEKITITLAGLSVQGELRQAVAIFNRQNTLYQIEIYEYLNQADIPSGDITPDTLRNIFNQAMLRFQVDLMTGNVPDIIVQPTYEMIDAGLLLDLNTFIDTDPEINRADFFPNALSAMEWSDGTLPFISNKFSIQTIMSRSGTLGHIRSWTPEEMLTLIHNTQDMTLPFGAHMLREDFLTMLIRVVNIDFIDFDIYRASFDNIEFINLLETAKMLPSISDVPSEVLGFGDSVLEILRMQSGQQLLSMAFFASPGNYQLYADSFEDSIALGIPTANGGVNIIAPYSQVGIGATTEHADAAWGFVRSFLLPSAAEFDRGTMLNVGFPIRIDLYEELIEDVKTPRTFINNEGAIVEYSREALSAYDGSEIIELYAMSDETANNLRIIIESAISLKRGLNDEIWEVIESDIADFYSGIRSSEETARIIQNRAEKWLSEQELLS
ncbi:MAG: hypothetical protein FWD38_10515 [Oscillospiraceae bacterium]|nr:hypothetical protein [Oscillospiraceae bacterium]